MKPIFAGHPLLYVIQERLPNWLIFVATTHLKIVVADMALVTQEG